MLLSEKHVKLCFLVTFNVILSYNFLENFISISSIDIEAIRTVFNFLFFFYKRNSKHLKHKQKACQITFIKTNKLDKHKQKHLK